MTFIEIDNYVKEILSSKYKKVIRRNYYELEKTESYLKGTGKDYGISFLLEPFDRYYMTINVYDSCSLYMELRYDDYVLVSKSTKKDLKIYLNIFLELVDGYESLRKVVNKFERDSIPKSLLRDSKLNIIIGK